MFEASGFSGSKLPQKVSPSFVGLRLKPNMIAVRYPMCLWFEVSQEKPFQTSRNSVSRHHGTVAWDFTGQWFEPSSTNGLRFPGSVIRGFKGYSSKLYVTAAWGFVSQCFKASRDTSMRLQEAVLYGFVGHWFEVRQDPLHGGVFQRPCHHSTLRCLATQDPAVELLIYQRRRLNPLEAILGILLTCYTFGDIAGKTGDCLEWMKQKKHMS